MLADYEKGILHFIDNGGRMRRYRSELKDLLEQQGIRYTMDPMGHAYGCERVVADSLIKIKFGENFIDELELVADSFYFEKRKNGTFPYYDLDTWALRKNNDNSLGGDFVINYLNERLTPKSSFRFISNIVNSPYYLIEFTIDKEGRTMDVEIKERNNTGRFAGTEELIIKEISKLKDWIPATIRNQPVTARFQMGVAILEE